MRPSTRTKPSISRTAFPGSNKGNAPDVVRCGEGPELVLPPFVVELLPPVVEPLVVEPSVEESAVIETVVVELPVARPPIADTTGDEGPTSPYQTYPPISETVVPETTIVEPGHNV